MVKLKLFETRLPKISDDLILSTTWLVLALMVVYLLISDKHPALFQQWKQPGLIKIHPQDQTHQQQRAEISLRYQTTPLALIYFAAHHLTLGNTSEADDLFQTAKHLAPNDPIIQRLIQTHFRSQQ